MMKRWSFTVPVLASTKSVRRGFTILELLVVFTVAAVLVAITGRGISSAFAGNSRSSAVRIASGAIFQARSLAIQRSSKSTLVRAGNTLLIYADSLGTRVQLGKTTDLNARAGVTLTSSVGGSRDSVMFDARGLIVGGTVTTYKIFITKGTKSDTVCIMGLGDARGRGC